MVRIVVKGKVYDRVSLANIPAGGKCYIVYCNEDDELRILNFDFEDIDEWVMTREAEQ